MIKKVGLLEHVGHLILHGILWTDLMHSFIHQVIVEVDLKWWVGHLVDQTLHYTQITMY